MPDKEDESTETLSQEDITAWLDEVLQANPAVRPIQGREIKDSVFALLAKGRLDA